MRLVKKEVKTVYTLAEDVKAGDFLQLENTMSCDIIQCKLLNVDDRGIKIVKLSNMETREYTYQQLEKFEFRKLRLGIVVEPTKEHKEVLREDIREDIRECAKKGCDEVSDSFEKNLRRQLEELYGNGVGMQFYRA